MANFVRRIVSGNKARFKDKHLDLELDLAYVTDHIIVMGFPATGVEGMYRNRRDHAKKFLDHRHGKNYWIFNFCPLRENSYPSSFFGGRVSRYPFPDHHAPPLAVLPLFVREAREWLSGSPDRVAVLHCKAGKGRSGTLACAYLLSLDETPTPPKLQRSMTKKELAMQRADQVLEAIETEDTDIEAQELEEVKAEEKEEVTSAIQEMSTASFPSSSDGNGPREEDSGTADNTRNASSVVASTNALFDSDLTRRRGKETCDFADVRNAKKPFSLDDVLTLHASRRMKLPSSPNKKPRYGVSIPSQRRWLHYWSLLLADAGPRNFWQAPLPRVRLLDIRVRIRDVGGVKMNLVRIANQLIEKTNSAKYGEQQHGRGPVWVSLARYDDELVDTLERWEKLTRSVDGNLGKGREGLESVSESSELRELFMSGKWDRVKMIRRFAHLGHNESSPNIQRSQDGIVCHTLRPLTEQKRELLRAAMRESIAETPDIDSSDPVPTPDAELSAASSDNDLARDINGARQEQGVILDAAREVRAKIYMGQVFMGWFWFIPAFHMPPVPASAEQAPPLTTHFMLTRKEVDFPIGVGTSLVDVDIALEWIVPGEHP